MKKFKIYTHQSFDHVENYLKERGLTFTENPNVLTAIYIDDPDPERNYKSYQYYWTTGRWAVLYNKKNKYKKHYCCKDIETLVDKYILGEKND